MKLTITLTSDLQHKYVHDVCVTLQSWVFTRMHTCSSSPYNFCVCMWHFILHTEPSQCCSVLQPPEDPTQLQPFAYNSVYFCLKRLPLAELILFGKLPSCLTLFIGQQLREQTRTKCHSQSERAPRGRAQSEGEAKGSMCVSLWKLFVFLTKASHETHGKYTMSWKGCKCQVTSNTRSTV